MSNELTLITEYYKDLFTFWNEKYYDNALPVPVFVIDITSLSANHTNIFYFKVWKINGIDQYEMRIMLIYSILHYIKNVNLFFTK